MTATSENGQYLIPQQGMTRAETEALLRDLFAGCTGLKKLLVRPKWKVEPDNVPPKSETWLSFAIASRESPRAQVLHLETEDGTGVSRIMTHETISVLVSVFGADAEDVALRLKAALQAGQNRESLYRAGMAFVRGGDIAAMPELVGMGWRPRADMTLVFRRAPKKSHGVFHTGTEKEHVINIKHAADAPSSLRVSK